jgi:uncharacterized protein (TIGR02145 family)
MKNNHLNYLLIIALILSCSVAHSQSKNKKLEYLEYKIDSINLAISSESEWIKNQLFLEKRKIADLKIAVGSNKRKIDSLNNLLNEQNTEYLKVQRALKALKTNNQKIEGDISKLSDTTLIQSQKTIQIKTVRIGNQIWSTKPIALECFKNGDSISVITSSEAWQLAWEEKQPACCSINFDPKNDSIYGKLYNFYALTDSRGIAPHGFAIPNFSDCIELIDFAEKNKIENFKSSLYWKDKKGTNKLNFNGTPSGIIDEFGNFGMFNDALYYWSVGDSRTQKYLTLSKSQEKFSLISATIQNIGMPIRLINPTF